MEALEVDVSLLHVDIEQPDLTYCDVYYMAIKKFFDIEDSRNVDYLTRYFNIAKPRRCYGDEVKDSGFADADINPLKDSLFFRMIHIYRSGLLMSSAVDFHFRNFLKANLDLLQKILEKRHLRICSIGGRLPSDVIALVKVLEDIVQQTGIDLDICLTIIENDNKWRSACYTVLSSTKTFRDTVWKMEYICADLPKIYHSAAVKAINTADIVTAVKFVSEFQSVEDDLSNAIKRINHVIPPGSLFFLLDFSKDDIIESSGGISGELPNSRLLYEEICDLHVLDPAVVEKNHYLYYKKILKPYFNKYLNAFVRVWLKTSDAFQRLPLPLASRFLKREKYNPRKNLLNAQSFRNWERQLIKEAEEMGFKRRGTLKFALKNKEERNIYLMQLLNRQKEVESARRRLLCNSAMLGEGQLSKITELDRSEWFKYLTEKRNFSFFKLKIYSFSMKMLNWRLEIMDGKVETVHKQKKHIQRIKIPFSDLCPEAYMKMLRSDY